jgi:ribosomal protein S27E
MKIIKFSKSYKDVFNLKKDFYNNNNNNLKKILKINRSYIKQKKRLKCKTCKSNLTKTIFYSHKVNYLICKKCGHLNGQSVEKKNFLDKLYGVQLGDGYGRLGSEDGLTIGSVHKIAALEFTTPLRTQRNWLLSLDNDNPVNDKVAVSALA